MKLVDINFDVKLVSGRPPAQNRDPSFFKKKRWTVNNISQKSSSKQMSQNFTVRYTPAINHTYSLQSFHSTVYFSVHTYICKKTGLHNVPNAIQ